MLLEIRTYRLRPGTRDEFHRIFVERCLPLLQEHGIDVVRAGASEADDEGAECYLLVRAFASAAERTAQEDGFYSSREWREGPRADIWSRIESSHTVVLTIVGDPADAGTADDPIAALRPPDLSA